MHCLELCNKLNNFRSLCSWDADVVNMLQEPIDWVEWFRICGIANPEHFGLCLGQAVQTFILKWDGDFVILGHNDVLGSCTGVSQTHKLGLGGSHFYTRRFQKAGDAGSRLGKKLCTCIYQIGLTIYQYFIIFNQSLNPSICTVREASNENSRSTCRSTI